MSEYTVIERDDGDVNTKTVEADTILFEDGVAAFYKSPQVIATDVKGTLVKAFRSWDEIKGPDS